jgi:hypothetical protein
MHVMAVKALACLVMMEESLPKHFGSLLSGSKYPPTLCSSLQNSQSTPKDSFITCPRIVLTSSCYIIDIFQDQKRGSRGIEAHRRYCERRRQCITKDTNTRSAELGTTYDLKGSKMGNKKAEKRKKDESEKTPDTHVPLMCRRIR